MFKSYVTTALRNLARNKAYTIINVVGLSIGIAASLLLFLVIQFETSFDDFHKNKDRIFRIGTQMHDQDGVNYTGSISFPAASAMRIDFPQIKDIAAIFKNGNQVTIDEGSKGLKKLNEDNFFYTEPQFFNIFNFDWLAGSPQASLDGPNSAVLTQAAAEKYFGDWKTALGKTFKVDNKTLYKVTGILKNPPANTDFQFSVVVPYLALQNTYIKENLNDWVSTFGDACTYVVLPPDLPVDKFNAQLAQFARKHKPAEYAKDIYVAQPLSEIHYDKRFGNFTGHTFSHSLITALALIGAFLILIACVNFINLATAQAVNRSREVGVRKVLGSNRTQLAVQFLSETALITLAAVLISLLMARVALPFLNQLLETKMDFNFLLNPGFLLFVLGLTLVVIILSGLYPAFILSGFNPIMALKSRITSQMVGGISLRRALVVLQFAIAQVLIIGMLIVVSQMNFFQHASLGFDKAAIITVPLPGDSASQTKMNFMRSQLLANPNILNASFSFKSPSAEGNWNSDFKFDHAIKNTNFSANLKWADTAYFRTYNLQFVAGRPYYPSDTVREFVVNETLLHKLGIRNPQEALGKELNFWDGRKRAKIVGVVRDFNSYSLRKPMAPVVLSTWKEVYQTIGIKIKPGTEKQVLPFIEKLWNATYPDYVYEYQFLDETIANYYKQEAQLSMLYKIFAAIAIFISCLGLYGLVSFMAAQRTKEVGIRKVLGASVANIIYLFSKEFTLLILLAFLIAGPVAYYIMNKWLQDYSYRIEITAWIFLLAIAGSIIVAWITVGHRAIKAAVANPVKSLRTE
jgi:predicted permease